MPAKLSPPLPRWMCEVRRLRGLPAVACLRTLRSVMPGVAHGRMHEGKEEPASTGTQIKSVNTRLAHPCPPSPRPRFFMQAGPGPAASHPTSTPGWATSAPLLARRPPLPAHLLGVTDIGPPRAGTMHSLHSIHQRLPSLCGLVSASPPPTPPPTLSTVHASALNAVSMPVQRRARPSDQARG